MHAPAPLHAELAPQLHEPKLYIIGLLLPSRLTPPLSMDPFTIITGLGGLLSLTIQITQLLADYVSSVQDAPIFATEVAGETSVLSLILKELQEFLRDAHQQSETKIDLHSLQQILEDCTATMLHLDAQMTGLKGFGAGKQLKQRFKWAYKEAAITQSLGRLQNHKRSLTLLLQLYVWYDLWWAAPLR